MEAAAFIDGLYALADENYRQKLFGFGIPAEHAIGVRMPDLRNYIKPFKNDKALAEALFESDIHEAKMAAGLIYPYKELSPEKADYLMSPLYSWDLVDQYCSNLFARTPFAKELPYLWSPLPGEFNRRAGIVMIACLSMKQKKMPDADFLPYLDLIREYIEDDRNFVKKAHSWALRTLGKRSLWLNEQVVAYIQKHWQLENGRFAYWAAGDAYRELCDPIQIARLREKAAR